MEQAVIWILGIIAFIILEAVTYQLVSIWFAIGVLPRNEIYTPPILAHSG